MKYRKSLAHLIVVACLPFADGREAPAASNDTSQFFEDEATVVIAARRKQKFEEAPSIVSVVTRDDIERYGARDLADILRLVPGFEFGMDVYSAAGSSFRGIWAHEGKSLLMINGITQNELGFGNYIFFGSIPASIIEKVEIIRGPGSAIYGGFAEVNVVNVITHQPENLNGMRASADVGSVGRGGASRYGNISYGSATDALRMAVHVGYGTELLSTRDYNDFFGNRLKQDQGTAYRQWQHLIAEASAKNLTVRYQRTSFTWGAQDTFTTIQPPVNGINAERINNYNDVTHLDYKAEVSDRWTILPLFEYTRNNTLSVNFPSSITGNFEGPGVTLWRYRGELAAVYTAPESAELRLGGGYIEDGVENVASDGTPGLQLSSNPTNLNSRAHTSSSFGLFQYSQQVHAVGVTVGGRYEDTNFGNALAPRAGLTYIHEDFNAKLLYGSAFRIPLPWQAYSRNLTFNGGLKPETANTTEMELGYKFNRHVTGKINTFFIDIKNPIVYQGNTNSYINFGKIQSKGTEAELKCNYGRYGAFGNISYAVPGRKTSAGFVTRSKRQFLASPPIKINLGTYYRTGIFELGPSVTYLSHRAGQSRDSANNPNDAIGTTDYPGLVLANMSVVARDVVKDLDVHVVAHNIFDTRYVLIQPYYGDHAPMPAQDREIDLGLTWHF